MSPTEQEAGVWIQRLLVHQFRSYCHAEMELEPAPVVLTGANGAGKTNLLEAISFLSPGRGLRGAKLGEVLTGFSLPSAPRMSRRPAAPGRWRPA